MSNQQRGDAGAVDATHGPLGTSDVVFPEEDVLAEQVGERDAARLAEVDRFAHEELRDAIVASFMAADAAIKSYDRYIKQRGKELHAGRDDFAKASKLVTELVFNAAKAILQNLPLVGMLAKFGVGLAFDAINGEESFELAARRMIEAVSHAQQRSGEAAPAIAEEHAWEIRNAWMRARDPSQKKAAVRTTLASLGLGKPAHDAGARIFKRLVESVEIAAWVDACRHGRTGKLADCATDAGIADIKHAADAETRRSFPEADEDKKKTKAQPMAY